MIMGIHVQVCMLCIWVYMFKYACCVYGYTCSNMHANVGGNTCLGIHAMLMVIYAHCSSMHAV